MSGLASKVGMVFASRLLIRMSQLVSFFLLARSLSLADFGIYGIVTSAIFFAGLVGNAGLRQSSARLVNSEEIDVGVMASTLFAVWPILSVSTCVVFYYLAPNVLGTISAVGFVCVLLSVAAYILLTLTQGVLLGVGDTFGFAVVDSGPRIMQSAFVLALWLSRFVSLDSVIITFSIGFVMFVPFGIFRCYRERGSRRIKFRLIPKLFSVGSIFSISLFLAMSQDRIGIFLLGYANMPEQSGNYFAAQRVSEILLDVATSLALIMFAETARTKDARKALTLSMQAALSTGIVFSVLGLAAALMTPILIDVVLGPNYHGARSVIVVFSLGLGPLAAARIISSATSGAGYPLLSAALTGVGLAANAGICWFTISRFGAMGAAAGMLAGQVLMLSAYIVVWVAFFRIPVSEIIPNHVGIALQVRGLIAQIRKRIWFLRARG